MKNSTELLKNKITCIIPAAGMGTRFNSKTPKQYLTIKGKSVLEHSITPFLYSENIDEIIIAIAPNDHYFEQSPIKTYPKVKYVIGGTERSDSVFNALKATQASHHSIIVHDAARPCITIQEINALLAYQHHQEGAILALPIRDTIKQVSSYNTIENTVPREKLWLALTPQLFPKKLLYNALLYCHQHKIHITDEASAVEKLNISPKVVVGNSTNIKLTYKNDLHFIHSLIQ